MRKPLIWQGINLTRLAVILLEAPGHGLAVFEYAPSSPGAVDYQTLTEKVLSS